MSGALSGGLGTVLLLFLVVLVILWILLPFAVFGTKDRLDKLISVTEQQNHLLAELIASLTKRSPD